MQHLENEKVNKYLIVKLPDLNLEMTRSSTPMVGLQFSTRQEIKTGSQNVRSQTDSELLFAANYFMGQLWLDVSIQLQAFVHFLGFHLRIASPTTSCP